MYTYSCNTKSCDSCYTVYYSIKTFGAPQWQDEKPSICRSKIFRFSESPVSIVGNTSSGEAIFAKQLRDLIFLALASQYPKPVHV